MAQRYGYWTATPAENAAVGLAVRGRQRDADGAGSSAIYAIS